MLVPIPRLLATALAVLLVASARPALAAWPNSPFVNLPVCTAAGGQGNPTIVSDGAGGAIVTWHDLRSGTNNDIYAQHVLASGAVDPAWPADGRALCTAVYEQTYPTIAADGAGGAIVTWMDLRSGANYDIYAQHVLASGAVDPAWPANGRALCTAANNQQVPTIVSDGAGGAIVSWHDARSGTSWDIYAQHVLASGAVDPAWPGNGRALCTAVYDQTYPVMVADGAGGAIVTWWDYRSGTYYDIYAQHVLAGGAVDPAWPADGRALCTAANTQQYPTIVSDGSGGAIVTWYDLRSGTANDIYAQHVLASGAVDPAWPADGRALCTATNNQLNPTIVSDGAGGAIVTWYDLRSGTANDIYAQHVLASGAVDPTWPADGRALCTATNQQQTPTIVSDGAGGAIAIWQDYRSGTSWDIYAQHVLASGAVDPAWPADGRALCTVANNQYNPTIVSDGSGGAIVTWYDFRSGAHYDIYAQRVARYGYLGTPEAEIASVNDVPNDQGGKVKLSWNASYLEADPYFVVTSYRLFRAVPPNLAQQALARSTRVMHDLGEDDDALAHDALWRTSVNGTTYYWEYVASVNADYLTTYSYLAPTAGDSTGNGNPKTAFMVQARTAGTQHWESQPDSGYSVDNLAPGTPAPFTGTYASGAAALHWGANPELDLAGYQLYRGSSPGFVPGPGNLVVSKSDTGYVDPAGQPYYYKLCAVDVHGNLSGFALLQPSGTTEVEGALPAQLALARPQPNPASGATTLGFALPRAGRVELAIYDASGRRVRLLASGEHAAGEHVLAWDLRDEAGRPVGAGLYFVRLESAGSTLTRRLATLR